MLFLRSVGRLAFLLSVLLASSVTAQAPTQTVLEYSFTPTRRAQIAAWVETADGEFLQTVFLTDLVARIGIGNRPGASQMNSGYRWPYGRREGVLPIWGTRRAGAPGAQQFKRVIFQDRRSEGLASRTSSDQSRDDYYCLSFQRSGSTRDNLDAVSCASAGNFSSDKGRFITESDVTAGYAEPYEDPLTLTGMMAPLSRYSLYPPRRDATRCSSTTCFDHADVDEFRQHALEVMPELDAITRATLPGDVEHTELFTVPAAWPDGEYVLWVEANVEGDYNDVYNDVTLPTPTTPAATDAMTPQQWDSWAISYGYPYRGQPSVVYSVPFQLGTDLGRHATSDATGAGSWDWRQQSFGTLQPLDTITDDPEAAPGSGVDRLLYNADEDSRLRVTIRAPASCDDNSPPSGVSELRIERHADFRHQHEWARLFFTRATDDDRVFRYDVRISETPMIGPDDFVQQGVPAKSATTFSQGLVIPNDGDEDVSVDFGGMLPSSTYYIGVRAVDHCNAEGDITFIEYTTTEQQFTTVTPCFVATATYGSPLANEIRSLRRFRDRILAPSAVGSSLIKAYYAVGPWFASVIQVHPWLRDLSRNLLTPIVEWAAHLDPDTP